MKFRKAIHKVLERTKFKIYSSPKQKISTRFIMNAGNIHQHINSVSTHRRYQNILLYHPEMYNYQLK